MSKYSQQLNDRIKKYFQEYYGLDISDELADEYLDSLAGLFMCFSQVRGSDDSPKGKRKTRTT